MHLRVDDEVQHPLDVQLVDDVDIIDETDETDYADTDEVEVEQRLVFDAELELELIDDEIELDDMIFDVMQLIADDEVEEVDDKNNDDNDDDDLYQYVIIQMVVIE